MGSKQAGEAYFMISAVSQRYDIHPQTLRLYEREGLLKPSRTDGNTRLYSSEDLKQLECLGLRKSIAIRPGTEVHSLYPFLERLDQVLIMSVEPGYGGQPFISQTIGKIEGIRREISQQGLNVQIQVDGGINVDTIAGVAEAGTDIAVVGSALFNDSFRVEEGLNALRQALERNRD